MTISDRETEEQLVSECLDLGGLRQVHHFNCGSFAPTRHTRLVTHVLACEFADGVVLVDTGLGAADIADPWRRLGRSTKQVHPALDSAETAQRQLSEHGLTNVQAIVATHLDYDHIGGTTDFPTVPVLTTAQERDAAVRRATLRERMRYRPAHIADIAPRLRAPSVSNSGDLTVLPMGLRGVALDAAESLYLVPMAGHTRGHAAVAVSTGQGWLVHAGDSFFHHSALSKDGDESRDEPAARLLSRAERFLAMDRSAIAANHRALAEAATAGTRVICSHDPYTFP